MTKLMIIPNKKDLDEILKYSNTILIGLDNYSVNFNDYFTLEEIKELSKKNIEIFVAINKNIHSNELENIKQILLELDKLNIKAILYYDIAIVKLKKDLKIKTDLVWSQEHLTTNYGTINFWQEYGVNYTYISPDITLNEILEIKQNTNNKLIVPIFGYLPMFVSERNIVKNYTNNFNLSNITKINYLEKENKKYPINDDKMGTTVYADGILNGYNEYLELNKNNIEYVTLNQFDIEKDKFIKIIEIFKTKEENKEKQIDEILNNNTSKHFLHKETIYRVKNNG